MLTTETQRTQRETEKPTTKSTKDTKVTKIERLHQRTFSRLFLRVLCDLCGSSSCRSFSVLLLSEFSVLLWSLFLRLDQRAKIAGQVGQFADRLEHLAAASLGLAGGLGDVGDRDVHLFDRGGLLLGA